MAGRRAHIWVTTTVTLLFVLLMVGAVWASGGHDGASAGALLKDFLWRLLNFLVLFGLLYYFLAKPLRKGMAERREKVSKELEEAKKVRDEAEAKFAEYEEKMAHAEAEVDKIYQNIREEAKAESERILQQAEQMAAKIKQDAERIAGTEIAKAQNQLRDEAVQMAMEIAEDILKKNITREDQARLVEEYKQKVGELN